MAFHSILFNGPEGLRKRETLRQEAPDFFADLHLDQIVDAVTSGWKEYELSTFFYTYLGDREDVVFRQEVMGDLEDVVLAGYIASFAQSMRSMRECLNGSEKYYHRYQKERLFLDSALLYCEGVSSLASDLSAGKPCSQGLLAFREYLAGYVGSDRFTSLLAETNQLLADLASVTYSVLARDLRVQVRPYRSETDYSAEVERIFAKFKQDPAKDYRVAFPATPEMNHVEESILEGVASLYPGLFQRLDDFCVKNKDYRDETVVVFDREIQFYSAYLSYIAPLRQAGLPFCYPEVSGARKDIFNKDGFDLALGHHLVRENIPVVCNDFYLEGKERILVVTGPNQGGKTTLSRTFGQLHYLAGIGCPVPGREARLFLFDRLFTHFEKEENVKSLRSKLEDDLLRIKNILDQSTGNSIIVLNEILSSTTLQDAIFLSRKIMERISRSDALCVWVTFIDELTAFNEKTVSMVGSVEPANPAVRTFKLTRRRADGLAYALSIAEKYRVTYDSIKERIPT